MTEADLKDPLLGTKLAIDRTRLAFERTMMAWVRTATALISFGFSIYKFFATLREGTAHSLPHHPFGSREFALVMIALGVGALVVALFENRNNMRAMRARFGQQVEFPPSLASGVGAAVAGLGILGFMLVLLRQ